MRLGLSFSCALIAAALWALTFTSISPTLGILVKRQNLQEWSYEEVVKLGKAIKELNAMQVGGRSLTVNEARPKEPRSGGGGFGGGEGRGRGGRCSEPRW